jgi:hypothetical protein
MWSHKWNYAFIKFTYSACKLEKHGGSSCYGDLWTPRFAHLHLRHISGNYVLYHAQVRSSPTGRVAHQCWDLGSELEAVNFAPSFQDDVGRR